MDLLQPKVFERPKIAQIEEPKPPSGYHVPDVTLLSDYDKSIYFKPGSEENPPSDKPVNILGNILNKVHNTELPQKTPTDRKILPTQTRELKENVALMPRRSLGRKEDPIRTDNQAISESQAYNPAPYKGFRVVETKEPSKEIKKPEASLLKVLDGMISKENKPRPDSFKQNQKKISPPEFKSVTPIPTYNRNRYNPSYVDSKTESRRQNADTSDSTNVHLCKIIEQQNNQILHLQKVIEKLVDHNLSATENTRSTCCETCHKKPTMASISTQTDSINTCVASTNTEEPQNMGFPVVNKKKSSLVSKKAMAREPCEKQVSFTLGDFCMNTIQEDPPSPEPSIHIDESLEYEGSIHAGRSDKEQNENNVCRYVPQRQRNEIEIQNPNQYKELSLLRSVKSQIEKMLEPTKKEVQFQQNDCQQVAHTAETSKERQGSSEVNILQQRLQQLGISFLDPSKLVDGQPMVGAVYQREVCSQIMSIYDKGDQFTDQQFAAIAEAARGNIIANRQNAPNAHSIGTAEYLEKYGLKN